jgi:hypothetical protein
MAVVQPMPRQVSAEWVRLIARHRCHITTHHPRLTIMRRPLRITVRPRHLTIALREEGAEVVDRMAAVRPVVVDHLTAAILLRVAVAATEDHDSSLKPLQFALNPVLALTWYAWYRQFARLIARGCRVRIKM